MKNILTSLVTFLLISSMAVAGGGHEHDHGHGHDQDAHDDHADEPERGPQGGRLLKSDNFAIEVTIFETDVPPIYRVYAYVDEKEIRPELVEVKIVTTRFGKKQDIYMLSPENNYLTVEKIVEEPHSFDVHVWAKYENKAHEWKFSSHEGRTELSEQAIKTSGIKIETAGQQILFHSLTAYGRLLANEDLVAHITPRFSGVVKIIKVKLGDRVKKGELLAVIESNQSLTDYELRAPIDGVIIMRHGTLGEYVPESQELFVLADLSEIWADFQIYREDHGAIKTGQAITIDIGGAEQKLAAVVSYVSPIIDEATQSKLIRAVIPNSTGQLKPGQFVSAEIVVQHESVPLAVRRDAIQTYRDWQVVYLSDGHVFQAMPVELGRKDKKYVEIVSGIQVNDRYVSHNSFLIKADIEKSGASHDH